MVPHYGVDLFLVVDGSCLRRVGDGPCVLIGLVQVWAGKSLSLCMMVPIYFIILNTFLLYSTMSET